MSDRSTTEGASERSATMTPDERQALREKHKPMDDGDGGFYCNYCREEDNGEAWYGWAMGVEWPCDVIKVLDATENLKPNDLKTKVECDHWVTVKRSGQYGYASSVSPEYWTHTFCPKCGEKL